MTTPAPAAGRSVTTAAVAELLSGSSPCRRTRAIPPPSLHERTKSSARSLRRRAREVASALDRRITARVTPEPPELVAAVQLLHRSAHDWLLVHGSMRRWPAPANSDAAAP